MHWGMMCTGTPYALEHGCVLGHPAHWGAGCIWNAYVHWGARLRLIKTVLEPVTSVMERTENGRKPRMGAKQIKENYPP